MEPEFKKILLKDLLFDCPEGSALKTCMTKHLRMLPLEERLKIVEAMEKNELDFIIRNHRECRLKRRDRSDRPG